VFDKSSANPRDSCDGDLKEHGVQDSLQESHGYAEEIFGRC
jgi:hypothetical protein